MKRFTVSIAFVVGVAAALVASAHGGSHAVAAAQSVVQPLINSWA